MVVTRSFRFTSPSILKTVVFISQRGAHYEPSTSRHRLKRRMKKQSESTQSSSDPYMFHPLVRTIEPINQVVRLTKTVIYEEMLPTDLALQNVPFEFEEILSQIHKSVHFNNSEDRDEDSEMKYIQRSKGLFANVVKAVWSSAISYPGLLRQTIAYQPNLKMYWKRLGYNLQVSGRTGLLFSSQDPLPNFASVSDVEKTAGIPAHYREEIISPVFELCQNSSRPIFDSGFCDDVYPFPRTLVITERNWKLPHLIAQGIMFSFGRLVERAISNSRANFGEVVKCPLSMRAVVFNDTKMALLCYQLNTLDFETDDGVKNQLWLMSDIPIPGATGTKRSQKDDLKSLVAMLLYGENDETVENIASNNV